jgi:hypothetical protein
MLCILHVFIMLLLLDMGECTPLCCTRSLFITWLSWHAQSGRTTSIGRWVRFIESHIVLVIFFLLIDLFIHLFLIWKACCYPVKLLNHFPVEYQSLHLQSLTRTLLLLHCSLPGLLSHWTACVRYLLLIFPHLNLCTQCLLPITNSLNICWQFKFITYGYEPSVTDANEPNKQMYKKCSATVCYCSLCAELALVIWVGLAALEMGTNIQLWTSSRSGVNYINVYFEAGWGVLSCLKFMVSV